MRCLFCKKDSSASKSVEHIIPESLGNKKHVLRRGIVCDSCNNYFSREVERPFLESRGVRTLRFNQALESKKGRIPPISGVMTPDIPAIITKYKKPSPFVASVAIPIEAWEAVSNAKGGKLYFPMAHPLPIGGVVSRFVAKVALEFMAARLSPYPEGLEYLCDEEQLDQLRDHARRGSTPIWPVHKRRIYDADGKTFSPDGSAEQVVHESDFLVTKSNEWYFVLAIFGEEMAINLGGPEIEGYELWLKENDGKSPLYLGRNADGYSMPVPATNSNEPSL